MHGENLKLKTLTSVGHSTQKFLYGCPER